MELWKQVPLQLTHGLDIEASTQGNLRYTKTQKPVATHKGSYNARGYYKACNLKGKTTYVYNLVYWAHTAIPIEELRKYKVGFRNTLTEGAIVDGVLACRYEDLVLIPRKKDYNLVVPEESIGIHPIYGEFKYGFWYTLHFPARNKERNLIACPIYELCVLDRKDISCMIRNRETSKVLEPETNKKTDPSYCISPEKGKPTKYKIVHFLLASVFPKVKADQTADHIDENPHNHHISNIQWMSMTKNAKGGQAKAVEIRKKNAATRKAEPTMLDGEIWKPLTLTDHTATLYQVSNMGRFRNTEGITRGTQAREACYRTVSVTLSPGVHVKKYVHKLVYQLFCTDTPNIEITDDLVIKHKDTVDGSTYLPGTKIYRNYACDLTLGTKSENNCEFHANRRAIAELAETTAFVV